MATAEQRTNTKALVGSLVGQIEGFVPEYQPVINFLRDTIVLGTEDATADYLHQFGRYYLEVIDEISSLSEDDLVITNRADELRAESTIGPGSASNYTTADFIRIMGPDRLADLGRVMRSGLTHTEVVSQLAVSDFARRLRRGHEYAQQLQGKLVDQDKNTHSLIFGHTVEKWDASLTPTEFLHFGMCHLLDRIFQAAYEFSSDEEVAQMAKTKDTFLNVITYMVRLRLAQGKEFGELGLITQMISNKRGEGGVGWGTIEKQQFYNQAVKEHATSKSK